MDSERLRVGDAERDEVVSALHEHFAQGRLTRDELDERLTTALLARTVGDLAKVTSDLPAPPTEPERRRRAPEPLPGRHGVPWTGFAPRRYGPPWPGPPMGYRARGRYVHRPPFGVVFLVLFLASVFTGAWVIFPLFVAAGFVILVARHAVRPHR
jgi:hypothetical protein